MPTANLSDIAEPASAPTGGRANLSDIEGPSAPQEKAGYFQELYRQVIADPIKAFKADPIGTLTHLIGGLGGFTTGTTPVPGAGGQIQVSGPSQMAGVADIAERGPAAIGAAATLGALPIAARYASPLVSAGASKLVGAVPSNATADVVGLASPRVANAIRVANRIKRGVQAFQNAGEEAPAAAEAVSPELQAMRDSIAKNFKYKDFASVKDPRDRATIEDLANRVNSGVAPEQTAPVRQPGPILVPRKFPPKTMRDIAQQELGQGNPPSGQDIIRGSSNIPLSEQGAAEAQRLAEATAGQFDKIYTSPLDRAQATARAVASTNPKADPPEPTEALTPWYLGAHEGQPTMKVLDKMQDLIQNKPDEVPAGRGPQSTKPGQSFNDFKSEFLGHVKDQVDNYEPGQKILNATHYRDTRVLEAWAKAGAPDDLSVDVPTMLEKGDVKPGDMLHLNPQTMEVKAVPDATEPGLYFARHGATAWNAENGTPNPAESVGAPGPAYHATDAPPFSQFDPARRGTGTDAGQLGQGYYFSTDKNIARNKATLIEAGVNLQKPLRIAFQQGMNKQDMVNSAIGTKGLTGQALTDAVKAKGYDGVILDYSPMGYQHSEIVAFDPQQINITKSGPGGGTVPQPPATELARLNAGAPPEATQSAEPFKAQARLARSNNAEKLATYIRSNGIPAPFVRFNWGPLARKAGIDWPATQDAQINLIQATRDALHKRPK